VEKEALVVASEKKKKALSLRSPPHSSVEWTEELGPYISDFSAIFLFGTHSSVVSVV